MYTRMVQIRLLVMAELVEHSRKEKTIQLDL